MASSEATVFIVDDDEAVRDSLGLLLRSAGHRARCYASARDFLKAFDPRDFGCLVLDIRMPGMSGLELQKHLAEIGCNIPIVFITGHGDIPMSVQAMKAGAVDFLPKPVKDTDLLRAIKQALARAVHDRTERNELADIRRRVEKLTPRELEVMALVVSGLLNKQIAFELGTVEKTIKVHRARVMEKMQAESLADLVRLAEKVGIPPKKEEVTEQ